MSSHRRRLHRRLAIGYLAVAFFAPVAHLHGRMVPSSDPVRKASFDHDRPATTGLADRPCECPACHFSTTHLALIELPFWFDEVSAAASGVSPSDDPPIHRPDRANSRGPPSI